MKILYSWLKDFIPFSEDPETIAELLTKSGLEVEGVEVFEKIKGGLKGLVIGEVRSCDLHPDADKLKKTTVDIGTGVAIPIVCGAPNVAVGQKVVVATVGASLYPMSGESFTIKKAKIRGEVSEGMLCAEDEIGLGESHSGIMVLDTALPAGTPASEYFQLGNDYVLEIGLTPNRGDAASHLGVSRDLKALLKKPLSIKTFDIKEGNSLPVKVEVQNPEKCIRYCGLTINGLTVKESPDWLKERLSAIGLSPINNIVDTTNYILHDLGQPLHAFDLASVKGNRIIVKTAQAGAPFTTLDGVKRSLNSYDLMIANEEEDMCIAGVFGGLDSGVKDTTTAIFLESACFSPDSVRKTSLAHGLKTDASFRFERGTDPNMPLYALKKAAALLLELAGGEITSEIIDIYPTSVPECLVQTSYSRINELIGKEIPGEAIKSILNDLDISVTKEKEGEITLKVPPYRVDVQREADVVEEVIRIYGYDNIEIPETISTSFLADFPSKDFEKLQKEIALALTGNGFYEIITNSLTSPAYTDYAEDEGQTIEILNKLSEDLGVLRRSLLFSGLEVVLYNLNRKQKDLKLFEFGKTYKLKEGKYIEENKLGVFLTGGKTTESWSEKYDPVDFYDLKQVVAKILEKSTQGEVATEIIENKVYQYGLSYLLNRKQVVSLGLLNDKILKAIDIKQKVWFAEFDLTTLHQNHKTNVVFQEISKFPEVRRDLSLILDKNIPFEAVRKLAFEKERKLLRGLNVFDVYEGKNIGDDKKSYAVSFNLYDQEKTLTDETIEKSMGKLMVAFEKELGAIIRK